MRGGFHDDSASRTYSPRIAAPEEIPANYIFTADLPPRFYTIPHDFYIASRRTNYINEVQQTISHNLAIHFGNGTESAAYDDHKSVTTFPYGLRVCVCGGGFIVRFSASGETDNSRLARTAESVLNHKTNFFGG